ncbi:hypothetical protein Sango_2471400 [Sesamum angolense]|uniref:Uncharacterized protein n=1 Tax=Sesamum angolense TaxID=2727404 RepID=A0AAE1W3H9_9LAMI|nr:hypothetical protein Sango_2471400 [Sesamum angolense]
MLDIGRRRRAKLKFSPSSKSVVKAPAVGKWKMKKVPKANKAEDVMVKSRRLTKDEVDLRLGNAKRVVVEAVGLVHLLVSDHVRIDLKMVLHHLLGQKVFVSRNAVFLEKGFPSDTRCEELFLEESSETTLQVVVASSSVSVVPREMTGQLDPKTYEEPMSDIDSKKWLENMRSEMDSISSNKIDVKTVFLNSFIEEEIYIDQLASDIGSIQFVVQYTRFDIAFALSVTSSVASFQSDINDAKSQSDFVFKLNGGVVAWKSSKQDTIIDSTTETEYITAFEAAKEVVWMKNYIQELDVMPSIAKPIVIFCDNNGVIVQQRSRDLIINPSTLLDATI